MKTTTILKLMATVLLIMASAVFLAACSDSDDDGSPAGDAAEHVDDAADGDADADDHDADADDHDADADEHSDDADEHSDDADDHSDDADEHSDDADEHSDDADEHSDDADEHSDDADDSEANAHLEAAPKDALFLVDMSVISFTPDVIEVKAGEVVEIAIQNSEATLHDFTIDDIDADVHVSYLGGTGQHEHAESAKEADVHFALTEAGSGVVHIKVHEPGEYVFYCSVPGHQAAGMEGTLIVTEA